MTVNVYLLLTLFARTQTQPPAAAGEEPALWLTVQPFIEPDDFETWITTATTPGALTYQLLADSPAQGDAAKLVPVPLPPGVSLTLRRLTNMGTTIVGPDIFNDRTGVFIIDPAGFQRDNVNPLKTSQRNPTASPYGQAYFDQLTEIHGDPGYDAGVLQQMFLLNFVGGSVRRFRDSTVSDQDKVNLFTLVPRVLPPGLSDGLGSIRTVGLVSACGLMLRLDKDIGFQQLRTVDTIELYLRLTTAEALPGTRINIPPDEQAYLRAYFAAIDPNNPVPSPSTFWQATILPDALTRVYVLPHRTALASAPFCFATNRGDQRILFRRDIRRADDITVANTALLSEIESIGLFYRRSTATDPQPSGPPSINIRFYELIEARLVAYRSSTAAAGSPSLWQLVPLPKDRVRFVSLFNSLTTTGGASAPWPTQYTIHDRFGFRIEAAAGFLETGFVGSYLLPWDDAVNTDPTSLVSGASSLPTVLFWFAVPVSGTGITIDKGLDVTLVVANSANSVAANYAPFEAADGTASTTGGPLWEWAGGTALPDTPWSALDLDASAPISRITPTFIRRGDYVTQPALSAQHTEGVLQVDYPGPPAGVSTVTVAAADVNPVDDFKREMVAYRKLNVYSQDTSPSGASGVVEALNPWSNLFPVWYTDLNGWHRHIFQYRFRSDIYTPTQANAPRAFFADIYSKLGGTRQITLDLEHTTGHAVPVGASPAPVKLTHDAPPTLPSSLRRALRSSQRKARLSETSLPPLLTVDFVPASNGSSELARVTLDPRYLVPDGTVQTDIDPSVVTAAWRSVAELAYSTTIQLRGQFRRFDFGQAVAAARTVNGPVNLFDGMVPVPPYEDKTADEDKTAAWAFPDTNPDGTPGLRAAARSWLAGARFRRHPKRSTFH